MKDSTKNYLSNVSSNILIICISPEDNFMSVKIRQSNIISYLKKTYKAECFYVNKISFDKKYKQLFDLNYLITKLLKLSDYYYPRLRKIQIEINNQIINNKPDVVFILARPFYLLRVISYIKKKHPNIKVILDLSDPCYMGKSKSFLKNLYVKSFENTYIRSLDYLIVLNKSIKTYYSRIIKNITVIEQGVDNLINNNNNYTSDNNVFRMVYGGKFHPGLREPKELFSALAKINYSITLDIYSDVDQNKFKYDDEFSERIFFKKPLNQELLFEEYHKCDFILHIDNAYGIQVPGKTFELLAFNKPILFIYENELSDTSEYMKKYSGVFMALNNKAAIIETLLTIIKYKDIHYERDVSEYYWPNLLRQKISSILEEKK